MMLLPFLNAQETVLYKKIHNPHNGFIWYALTEQELEGIIAHPFRHILENNNQVVGYILGCDLQDNIQPNP